MGSSHRSMLAALLVFAAAVTTTGCDAILGHELNSRYCAAHPGDLDCPAPPVRDANVDAMVDADAADAGPRLCTSDVDCAETPNTAVCDLVGTRMCVQCTPNDSASCSGATPVCSTTNACRACQVDDECTSSKVCDAAGGSCLAEDTVLYVSPTGTGALCTQAQPCGQLAIALGLVAGDKKTIKMLPGSYTERVTMTNLAVTIHGQGAALSEAVPGEIIRITGSATIAMLGLRIHDGLGGSGDGILCTNDAENTPVLTLDGVAIDHNGGLGINATKCSISVSGSAVSDSQGVGVSTSGGSLTISRATVSGNHGGGISAVNGTFDITNTFITRNGDSSTSAVGGSSLAAATGSSNRFEFNTVADNQVKNGGFLSGGVACDITGFTAPNNIIAHNLINNDTTQPTSNTNGLCTYPTSSVTASLTSLNFTSPDNMPYDYHLLPGSSAINQGTTPSMIRIDRDGDARPQGAANDQGADEAVQN